jgi:predicted nucleic acid-binding protein
VILVDSSVWIGYFRGVENAKTARLHGLLGVETIAIGDLILVEVLQGIDGDREFREVERMMSSLAVVPLCGMEIAIRAATHFRTLRKLGITVRKTIDCVIATCCIESGMELLHDDRDFDPFEKHLGLKVVG